MFMKKVFQPAIILLLIIILTSCRKTNTGGTSSTNAPLLKQYVILDTNSTIPNDTLVFLDFTYDNSKRITQMLHYEYPNPSYVLTLVESFSFFYNNADTLPYKLVVFENENGTSGTNTVYYSYAGTSNTITEDSTVSPSLVITNKYAYTNNTVIRNQAIVRNGTLSDSYIDTFYQTRSNGNIISQLDTLYHNGQTIIQSFTYQFDNHPNPLYKTYPPVAVLEEDGLNESPQQKNNYTSVNEYSSNNGSTDVTNSLYSFSYSSNGYPVKSIQQDNYQNNATYESNNIFIYQ
jgi:hypothetical protein